MGGKRNIPHYNKQTNVEKMIELENNHFVTVLVITDSVKEHQ